MMKKNKIVYLDYAATTPMDPRVIEEFNKQMKENYGNSSSLHAMGQ
ncbi:MAG: aminotransferase class V-fold PLP-dependent enzyme, partial [Promethearchaeota archaeon]